MILSWLFFGGVRACFDGPVSSGSIPEVGKEDILGVRIEAGDRGDQKRGVLGSVCIGFKDFTVRAEAAGFPVVVDRGVSLSGGRESGAIPACRVAGRRINISDSVERVGECRTAVSDVVEMCLQVRMIVRQGHEGGEIVGGETISESEVVGDLGADDGWISGGSVEDIVGVGGVVYGDPDVIPGVGIKAGGECLKGAPVSRADGGGTAGGDEGDLYFEVTEGEGGAAGDIRESKGNIRGGVSRPNSEIVGPR